MHRNLPPFPAVRAFEASARHCSFKLAAGELCLTQSAISHQVKTLEDYLGVQLFFRETRGVALTSEGAGYLHELTSVLDRMAAATAQVRNSDASGPLSVRATPGLANRWLVPRLTAFHQACPAIELNISTSIEPADFAKEDVDVDIRWGCVPSPGLRVDPLITATRFPVASPALLKNGPALHHPDALQYYTLLQDSSGNDWGRWLALAGARFENAIWGPRFAHCDLLLTAAVENQGVALAFDILAVTDLANGRLVRLFDVNLPPMIMYSVVTPETWSGRPKIAAFRNWLLQEAGAGKQDNGHAVAAA
jgi:LysR family transcriptional regulator, glycine cleavage system transcriptional activator